MPLYEHLQIQENILFCQKTCTKVIFLFLQLWSFTDMNKLMEQSFFFSLVLILYVITRFFAVDWHYSSTSAIIKVHTVKVSSILIICFGRTVLDS